MMRHYDDRRYPWAAGTPNNNVSTTHAQPTPQQVRNCRNLYRSQGMLQKHGPPPCSTAAAVTQTKTIEASRSSATTHPGQQPVSQKQRPKVNGRPIINNTKKGWYRSGQNLNLSGFDRGTTGRNDTTIWNSEPNGPGNKTHAPLQMMQVPRQQRITNQRERHHAKQLAAPSVAPTTSGCTGSAGHNQRRSNHTSGQTREPNKWRKTRTCSPLLTGQITSRSVAPTNRKTTSKSHRLADETIFGSPDIVNTSQLTYPHGHCHTSKTKTRNVKKQIESVGTVPTEPLADIRPQTAGDQQHDTTPCVRMDI